MTTRSEIDDIVDLLDHAFGRLSDRIRGLTDDEWSWNPAATNPDLTIRWRLAHLTDMLADERNRTWLGLRALSTALLHDESSAYERSSAHARHVLEAAYADLRTALLDGPVELEREIGPAAGPFGTATRRSFVLRIADELIHHGAEVAVLRDL